MNINDILEQYSTSDEAIAREIQLAVANYIAKNPDIIIHSFISMHPKYKDRLTNTNQFKVVRKTKTYTVTITTDE